MRLPQMLDYQASSQHWQYLQHSTLPLHLYTMVFSFHHFRFQKDEQIQVDQQRIFLQGLLLQQLLQHRNK